MSTEYEIHPGFSLVESSSYLTPMTYTPTGDVLSGERMDEAQACRAIIKFIEAVSYIAEDPDVILDRFNVKYGGQQ
jgi:hypothetical protein